MIRWPCTAAVLVAILVPLLISPTATASSEPRPVKAVLHIRDLTLKPVRVRPGQPLARRCGDLDVTIEARHRLRAVYFRTGGHAWTSAAPEGRYLEWLAVRGKIAYLRQRRYPIHETYNPWVEDDIVAVRRLSLQTGRWLPPLVVPADFEEAKKPQEGIRAALPLDDRVVVLSSTEERWWEKQEIEARVYRVTCFRSGKVVWSRAFPRREREEQVPWGYRSLRPLSFVAEQTGPPHEGKPVVLAPPRVLVQAGPREDMVWLDPTSGEEVHRLAKIWEYRRGFTGPSVWQHNLHRVPEEELPEEVEIEVIPGKRRRVPNPRWLDRVIGGPFVVPRGTESRILVAIGTNNDGHGHVMDGVVYEIDRRGWPMTRTTLFRPVEGSDAWVVPDGLVWRTKGEGLLRFGTTAEPRCMPGAGGDRVGNPVWFRGRTDRTPGCWLRLGTAFVGPVLDGGTGYRVPAGAYVEKREDRRILFPLSAVDTASGEETWMTVEVFLDRIVIPPERGSWAARDDDGSSTWSSNGRQESLAVTRLVAEDGRLEVTVSWSNTRSTTWCFDVEKAFRDRPEIEERR